jgi:hypothetical protein
MEKGKGTRAGEMGLNADGWKITWGTGGGGVLILA